MGVSAVLKSASFSTTECRFASRPALLFIQADLIADHCDELAVRGFSSQVVDGIAKVAVQGIHIAAVPGDFNSVADGALHAGSRVVGTIKLATSVLWRMARSTREAVVALRLAISG